MRIVLDRMILRNFKNCKNSEYSFYEKTLVKGKNGIGKSTLQDAFMWLFFDTDSEMNTSPSVRRMVNGEPDESSDVSVEAICNIDGKEVSLKKVQKRKYNKDRTKMQDENSYFINGIPKQLKDFKGYFEVELKNLQMCGNINAFLVKNKKDMRTYLFDKADSVSDLEIAERHKDLSELACLLRSFSMSEIETKNKAEQSIAKCQIPMIDGRIAGVQSNIDKMSGFDIESMKKKKKDLEDELKAIENMDESFELEKYRRLSKEYVDLAIKVSSEKERNRKLLEERKYKQNEKIQDAEIRLINIKSKITNKRNIILCIEEEVEGLNEERQKEADLWKSTRSKELDEKATICPTCGREFSDEEKERIISEFDERKEKLLKEIEKNGQELKSKIDGLKAEKEKILAEKESLMAESLKIEDEIKALKEEFSAIECENLPESEEHRRLAAELKEKEDEMSRFKSLISEGTERKKKISELRDRLEAIGVEIAKSDTTEYRKQMEELKKQRLGLAQKEAECQKMAELLKKFESAKNESLTDEINKMFSLVDWKMFEYAKNGNYNITCIPMVDKKSILSSESNKGNKILGKVDIVSTVQRLEGVSFPVFLDDVESLDDANIKRVLDMIDSQVIILKVTNDGELKIENME